MLVSNRLPVSVVRDGHRLEVHPSSGGLVTALGPVLRHRGGVWIGWPGITKAAGLKKLLAADSRLGFDLLPVALTEQEQEKFYLGFSNEVIWPLFHGLQSLCNYDPEFWRTYTTVNKKFADAVANNDVSGTYLWVHDYHLMSAGRFLRAAGVRSTLGFFLHIPFPPPDIFQKLPWRHYILRDLLEYDLIGFQTERHKRNFLQSVRLMLKEMTISGKGAIHRVATGAREVRVGSFPIGIDYASFAEGGRLPEVKAQAAEIKDSFGDCVLILGVDRLDYTKGIPYKLQAFRRALLRHPELRKKVTLIQVVVPSREEIATYHDLKAEIDQLVGEINGQLAVPGWTPIHYIFRNLTRTELLAYYRAAEIGLVTPLEDGMNLVAKEFCAVDHIDESVLILSEFAGAAAQLQSGAILVNPYDIEGVADALHTAFSMDSEARKFRMRKLRKNIREQDVFWWVDNFLKAGASNLEDYPMQVDGEHPLVEASWWWDLD
ncbi:MAG: trehalose-6-phosphate synthase [bacterium]